MTPDSITTVALDSTLDGDVAAQYIVDTAAYTSEEDLQKLIEGVEAEQVARTENLDKLPSNYPTSPRARKNKEKKILTGGWEEDRKKAKLLEIKVPADPAPPYACPGGSLHDCCAQP